MEKQWTVRRVLAWMASDFEGKGIESARLDAEVLLAHALQIERIALYLNLDRPLSKAELAAARQRVERRRTREPVAYILGRRDFWGRTFAVSPAVLIPRPDTETLVERALAIVQEDQAPRVLDLCTGSGCIAVTIAAERPNAVVHATDISPEALAIAARNAASHEVQVRFHAGDLYADAPEAALITANPPYIRHDELATLEADVAEHEPHLALDGGEDGLVLVRRVLGGLDAHLTMGGTLLMEVGAGQAGSVANLFRDAGLCDVQTHSDLGGIERVVEGRRR